MRRVVGDVWCGCRSTGLVLCADFAETSPVSARSCEPFREPPESSGLAGAESEQEVDVSPPLVALVVDSDPALRSVVRVRLELDGWQVREARTPSEANDRLSYESPAAVIIDTGFADNRGVELAQQMRRDGCGARMILLSVWFTPTVAVDAGPTGIAVVSKLNFDALWGLLDEIREQSIGSKGGDGVRTRSS